MTISNLPVDGDEIYEFEEDYNEHNHQDNDDQNNYQDNYQDNDHHENLNEDSNDWYIIYCRDVSKNNNIDVVIIFGSYTTNRIGVWIEYENESLYENYEEKYTLEDQLRIMNIYDDLESYLDHASFTYQHMPDDYEYLGPIGQLMDAQKDEIIDEIRDSYKCFREDYPLVEHML